MRYLLPVAAFLLFALGQALSVDGMFDVTGRWPESLRVDTGRIVGVGLWLTGAWLGTRLVKAVLERRLRGGPGQLPQLLGDVAAIVIFAGAMLMIVGSVFGLPLGGLLATSGVFAAIIGLAIQRTIADVFAGIAINIDQSVRIGDWIELASGTAGQVTEITWRATRLLTMQRRTMVVPNSLLVGNQFTNCSMPTPVYRTVRTVRLEYAVPPERAVAILQAAMEATQGVLASPPPVVFIDDLEGGVLYAMRFFVADYAEQFPVGRAVSINALRHMDRAGIVPARPKRQVEIGPFRDRIVDRLDPRAMLERAPFFRELSAGLLDGLAAAAQLRELPAQTPVIRQGDRGDSLFLVITGTMSVHRHEQVTPATAGWGREIARLTPGDLFGEMSVLTGAPRAATVVTVGPTTLLELAKPRIAPLLNADPTLINELSRLQAARLSDNLASLSLTQAEQQEVTRSGVAGVLSQRIARFFGVRLPTISAGQE